MAGVYQGKEVCQGCKVPGTEKYRWYKEDLCDDCKKLIAKGKAAEFEEKINYTHVSQFYHALSSLDFSDNTLNGSFMNSLESINNKTAEASKSITGLIGDKHYDNRMGFNIPTQVVEPIKILFEKLDKFVNETAKKRKMLSAEAKSEAYQLKDEIYRQGVEKGRNLLQQLNAGEITLDTFNKDYHL